MSKNKIWLNSMARKGNLGSGILYFVLFLMMVLIALGIVSGTYAFFGKGQDFRETEAGALFHRVSDCFGKNNFFSEGFIEKPDLFFKKCGLSQEVLEDGQHVVYVKRISDDKEFFVGVYDFIFRCGFDEKIKNKNKELPICKSLKGLEYELIVGSSQNSRRVSA